MSIPFSASDAVRWTGGGLVQGSPDVRFQSACIDTRSLEPGGLFLAIVGPTHDAHRFLAKALSAGAAGLLIEKDRALPENLSPQVPVIAADDTTRALGALAGGHRASFDGPLVAITGSNGKTTTKEMCAAILSVLGPCLKNQGNLNNQFGLPLTLLRRSESDQRVVVEIGMNHRGEIAPLAALARPTVGVITNVGTAHIEHLGSREEIAQEKGDLVAALPADGVAVLNADDPRVVAQGARTAARVVRFGSADDAHVRPESVKPGDHGFQFDLCAPEGRTAIQVAGVGETTVINALAAAAGALAAGASLDHVRTGLARYQPPTGRMQRIDAPGGVVLLDDSYNANPQSMEAALVTLARTRVGGRGIVVLGSMGELGEESVPAHAELGRRVASLGFDFLFALGEHAAFVTDAAVKAGMDPKRVRTGGDHADLASQIAAVLEPGDWVLVKGSRAMQMERVVERLTGGGH
jgi:UDP-N-acetylmuramoyl-tripeptide--D-alanyl-D-alanine ligase